MPAQDIYHDCLKNALIGEGCKINHHTFNLKIGKQDLYIDLGANQLIASTNAPEKIAVALNFVGYSHMFMTYKILWINIFFSKILIQKEFYI